MKTNILSIFSICLALVVNTNNANAQCNHIVVGYWQSWDDGVNPVIPLRDVPCSYNIVDVAFLSSASSSNPTMSFPLDSVAVESTSNFKQDVKTLQGKGIAVLASIGGANGTITISSAAKETEFINSLESIINAYGFNGLDIDIENGLKLNSGDVNYQSPTTPTIIYLIDALKQIKTKYGSGFYITMAPQTANVQGAKTSYAGVYGSYLPIIYGLQSDLNYIYVQYYNTGSCEANDGKDYNESTADFTVAMTDMLLSGFTTSNGQSFGALPQTQVAFGLPATSSAAGGGYMSNDTTIKALNYLTKGISYGGQYVLKSQYPNLAGIMTWSISYDSTTNYAFANTFSQYFCGTPNFCSGITTGTSDISTDNISGLDIYPNPASNEIHIKQASTIETMLVYNEMGELVMKIENTQGNTLDISTLPSGMYYIRALGNNQEFKGTFIKI